VSIRAYGVEAEFKKELRSRLDHYVRMARLNYDLNRWIGIRLDSLGSSFTASLAAYLTYASTINAADIGFSLNRAVEFTSMILYVVRVFNLFQVEANRSVACTFHRIAEIDRTSFWQNVALKGLRLMWR
jgi:hypothetical protein